VTLACNFLGALGLSRQRMALAAICWFPFILLAGFIASKRRRFTDERRGSENNLDRFLDAQQDAYERALSELQRGRKETHWMWFIFPQLEGLGSSPAATRYAIKDITEAEAYLRHPVLGPRLLECAHAVLNIQGRSARDILGSPDDLKLRSCATLFAAISPAGSAFHLLIDQYFSGHPDSLTLNLLGR
jgi:uncharacterized protein (DUF1810 family)